MTRHTYTFLALGDSYTIGEAVPLYESLPYQAVQQLRKKGMHFHAPEIVAKTGWTTFELAEKILHMALQPAYDFVSLLIGVNNQYRGLPLETFTNDFEFLLKKAIHYSGDKPAHVLVLSIPDWGVTPFAKDRDAAKIAVEIDAFNVVVEAFARQYKVEFIDVTTVGRQRKDEALMVAEDGLHPSAEQYKIWAGLLVEVFSRKL